MTSAALPDRLHRQRRRACRAAAALALSCAALAAAAQPDLAWIDRKAVAAREILVNADRGDRPLTVLVKIAAEVDAPPTAIWEVLKACEIASAIRAERRQLQEARGAR